MVENGRVVYAFSPTQTMLDKVAKKSGSRPVLLSYYYMRKKDSKQVLENWRKFSEPWTLIIDSGVYTLQSKLKMGIIAANTQMLNDFTEGDWERVRQKTLEKKELIDSYVEEYANFLKDTQGLYDVAVEMDVDNLMGVEHSDRYYERLTEAIPPDLLMRVWHKSGRDYQGWLDWIDDQSMEWVCIEGGTINQRDYDFYKRFVFPAKDAGKKVHILAMTIPNLLSKLPIDTTDSSTFVNGGRYGTIKIPGLGEVAFSASTDLSKDTSSTKRHYSTLKPEDYQFCLKYFKENGFTLDELLHDKEAHYNRIIITIWYYDKYVDIPYIEQARKASIF